MERKPKIAILRWEAGHVPKGLLQLEEMPGNSTNSDSYPFPVKMVHIKGANVDTIITNPSPQILQDMIAISKKLIEDEGIKAITTSCGFNAVFQTELSAALTVPVFTSALLQVPFVQCMIGKDKTVAVITASKTSLTTKHLRACGITEDMNVEIFGLEQAKEWGKIFDNADEAFDIDAVSKEIIGVAKEAVAGNPNIAAIVLECTDLPPYATKMREALGLPVFDFNAMMGYIAIAMEEMKLY